MTKTTPEKDVRFLELSEVRMYADILTGQDQRGMIVRIWTGVDAIQNARSPEDLALFEQGYYGKILA